MLNVKYCNVLSPLCITACTLHPDHQLGPQMFDWVKRFNMKDKPT